MPLDAAIRSGLTGTPKQLPSALFYDALGSQLFEAITLLPEYEVSRAGARQLRRAADGIASRPGPTEVVELGPGGGANAQVLVEALRRRQERVRFLGVDVSQEALAQCRRRLEEIPGVECVGVCGEYVEGLRRAVSLRSPDARLLVPFLGSNVSNFSREEARAFLGDVRRSLAAGDALLLAADLEKPAELLLPAYDDAVGVTAAFNRNILQRLNREWGADFDLAAYAHEARWNAPERRIEMHLRARRSQSVRVAKLGLDVRIEEGETIWTESSHRFRLEELREWATAADFRWGETWVDEAWPFALCLLEA